MGKLVKRAELSILGAIGIALFSSNHLPAFLSSLESNLNADPNAYTASVMAPFVENTASQPSAVMTVTPSVDAATTTPDVTSAPTSDTDTTVPEDVNALENDVSDVSITETQ